MRFAMFTEDYILRKQIQATFDKLEKKLKTDPRTMHEIGSLSLRQYLDEKVPVVRNSRTTS